MVKQSMIFSILTYNIHHGATVGGKYNLSAVVDVIKASRPQIVGLNEVDKKYSERSNWDDQVETFKRELNLDGTFSGDVSEMRDEKIEMIYGNLLLAKFKIEKSKIHRMFINNDPSTNFERSGDVHPRSIIQTLINIDGVKVWVLLTQLTPRDNLKTRLSQVQEIRNLVGKLKGPLILFGDFNASSDSKELTFLRQDLVDPSEGENLITKPDEKRQIDYILTRDLECLEIEVVKSDASDHYPLLAKLKI